MTLNPLYCSFSTCDEFLWFPLQRKPFPSGYLPLHSAFMHWYVFLARYAVFLLVLIRYFWLSSLPPQQQFLLMSARGRIGANRKCDIVRGTLDIPGNFNLFIKKGEKANSCKIRMCKEHECMCSNLHNTFYKWEKWMRKLSILKSHYFQITILSNSLSCDIFEVPDFSLSHKGHAAGSLDIEVVTAGSTSG